MLELLRRSRKILFIILRNKYPCSKLSLWITWLRLIMKSVRHHKSKVHATQLSEYIPCSKVHFTHFGSLIDLFEEIFILQSYRVDIKGPAPVIIDAGSNIGMSVLYFNMVHPNATIICFEPDAQSFELLRRNLLVNELKNVICHRLALSDMEGEVKLFSAPSALNSGLYGSVASTYQIVPSKKLSSFLDREIDLLKIDIEGAEDLVISDLINSGKIGLIKKMIIEHHPAITHHTTSDFVAQLQEHNFRVTLTKNQLHAVASEVLILAERA